MSRGKRFESARRLFFLGICRGYADENQGIGARERDAQENLACHVCGGVGDGQNVDEVEQHETDEQSHGYEEQVNDERPNSNLFPPPTR